MKLSVPFWVFFELAKHWEYILKGSVSLFSHLHNTRQQANNLEWINEKQSFHIGVSDMKSTKTKKN